MLGVIDFLRTNPASVPAALYIIGLFIAWVVGRWREDVLREDLMRLGSDWCFLAFALCVGALLDPGSKLRVLVKGEDLIYAAVFFPIVVLLVFAGANSLFRWARDTAAARRIEGETPVLQLLALTLSHGLGFAVLLPTWLFR